MFVRILKMKLKPNEDKGLTRAVDQEIIPILKKFAGFAGEFTLVSKDKKEALGVTLWERQENFETYDHEESANVLKILGNYIEGKPAPQVYDVTHSTVETFPVRKAA